MTIGHGVESELNFDKRTPFVLLLDTSESMGENSKIDSLNKGIELLREDLRSDGTACRRVEILTIGFGGTTYEVHGWVQPEQFRPPFLSAKGATPMAQAIELAIEKIEERKKWYDSQALDYTRPWIFMITDGAPTDDYAQTQSVWGPKIEAAAAKIRDGEKNKKFLFWTVGVDSADMDTLTKIAPASRPPKKLKDVQSFKELFEWLSRSMIMVSQPTDPSGSMGGSRALPSPDAWSIAPID